MDAGKLNKKITIQKCVETRDTDGSNLLTWSDVTNLWSEVKYKGMKQDAVQTLNYNIITMHFTIRKRDIDVKENRVKYNNQYFKIETTFEENKQFITLVCTVVE